MKSKNGGEPETLSQFVTNEAHPALRSLPSAGTRCPNRVGRPPLVVRIEPQTRGVDQNVTKM